MLPSPEDTLLPVHLHFIYLLIRTTLAYYPVCRFLAFFQSTPPVTSFSHLMAPYGPTLVASITIPRLDTPLDNFKDQDAQVERFHSANEEFFAAEDLDPTDVHPLHAPSKPSLERFSRAASAPVIMTPNPMVPQQIIDGSPDCAQELPINTHRMTINTPMLEGILEVHFRGLPTSQKKMFEGKKRHFHVMAQGRFKRAVPAESLMMGQEFVRPAENPWMAEMLLTAAAKAFSSSTKVDVRAALPYFMNPVLAAFQMVNISQPGSEPSLTEATEDMRLFADELADKKGTPLSPEKRRKWCDNPKNLAGRYFTPDHVYTMHIWQHLIDFSSYKASLGGLLNLDLTQFLACQPLQLTCKDTSADEYMFSMLVWHEKLLYGRSTAAAASELGDKLSRFSSGFKSLLNGSKR